MNNAGSWIKAGDFRATTRDRPDTAFILRLHETGILDMRQKVSSQ